MERIRLAPLCGVTDHIYRTLCFEQGCETAYTEMISAMGYLCAPDQRAQKELMIRGDKEEKLITLYLTVDEKICTMYEYFDIFLDRMTMCSHAARILDAKFSLKVNGQKVL